MIIFKIILISVLPVIFTISLNSQDLFNVKQLTFDKAQNGFPTWSPDSKSIVYQYTDLWDTTGKNGLWRINSDGTGAEQIFHGVAEHARWSPKGQYIVFDADTGNSIKMIPADGGKAENFLPDTVRIEKGGLPCWSPDETRIAFKDAEHSLCIYNRITGKVSRIFSAEGTIILPACWTRDGKYIMAALMERESRKSEIWKISPDGREKIQFTGHKENFYRYIALSPDESFLIYGILEGRYAGLYIMPADGGISVPFAVTKQNHNESPAWSPDGKKIAFTSTRSGSFDIWVMDVDIPEMQKKSGIIKY